MSVLPFIKLFLPKRSSVVVKEKVISAFASIIAILLVMLTSQIFLQPHDLPWVVASMGASAVLLFAVPQGPLSQPWPFIGGHLISAFVGVTVVLWVDDIILASCLAVSLAIFFMYLTGSLHPPGGATALTVVVGGSSIQSLGYQYLITPVGINLLVMLLWALIINNLLSNRSYPNGIRELLSLNYENQIAEIKPDGLNIGKDDLHAALKEMNVFVDVSEQDLNKIFHLSVSHLRKKRLGEVLCQDIMTTPVFSVEYGTDIELAWELMINHHIHGLPVVDKLNRVIGLVSIEDFLNQVKQQEQNKLKERFKTFVKRTKDVQAEKLEYVGHIMNSPATSIRSDQHINELFACFYQQGHHHLPVVDEENKLVGMITPKDLLSALHSDRAGV